MKYFSGVLTLWVLHLFMGFSAGDVLGAIKSKKAAQLIPSIDNTIELVFTVADYQSTEVMLTQGISNILSLENGSSILEAGAPDLQKLTASVIIPNTEKMSLEIVDSEYYEVENIQIAPSKGNVYRNQNPADIPFSFGPAYSKNAFYPGNLAELRTPYILRDVRGQTVIAYPLQYNPVTKILRVYTKIQVKLNRTGEQGENILFVENPKKRDAEFNQIYRHQFLNFEESKYTAVGESGNMLIICPAKYMDAIAPLANWKSQRGLQTEVVEFNETTTGVSAIALQTYIKKYYQEKGITFLLLVGDAEDIPVLNASGDSDVAYSYMAGNDSYPEFFVGRMSASTSEHVQTQVEKTIVYERDMNETANWLSNGLGLASSEGGSGTGDDGESDKQHMEKIKADLLSFTYQDVTSVYDPGATTAKVSSAINSGVGIINYVGHGSDFSWGTSGFNVSAINKLTNQNRWPFIFDVACINGNFRGQTCFAETFMRARNNNLPTGAVAIIASTINQAWNPPMDAQDEMVDILIESYENNIKRTFGGIVYNGCLHMNDQYGSAGEEMTDTWTTFGDPSLLVRTAPPSAMEVWHTEELLIGAPSLEVFCNTENASVSISNENALVATALVTNGVAHLELEPFTTIANLDVVVTAFNKITYLGKIKVIPAAGPYITVINTKINDLFGNNNSALENNEETFLDIQIQNVGVESALNVIGNLTCTDKYINITNPTYPYGTLQSGILSGYSSFSVHVSDSAPNLHPVSFKVTFSDSMNNHWTHEFGYTINAPQLVLSNPVLIEDGTFGNGNNQLEPGESAIIVLQVSNQGKNSSSNEQIKWNTESPYVTIENTLTPVASIEVGGIATLQLIIKTDSLTPPGSAISVWYDWGSSDSLLNHYDLVVGQSPSLELGTGTLVKYNYPFYNYYRSNKTQILFLASEFEPGNHIIDELSFNFASFTKNAPDRFLNNFLIKMGVTQATEMETGFLEFLADTAIFSPNFELPDSKGLSSIEIDPFNYTTSDGNLVVEIYWGINENYCSSTDRTSVYTTETTLPMVAYGYADTEYPAFYDGLSKFRPNILIGMVNQNLKQDTLSIQVVDADSIAVTGALVTIGSQSLLTDSLGSVSFYLAYGNYGVNLSKNLYQPADTSVLLNDTCKQVILRLHAYENVFQTQFVITDGAVPIEDAAVAFNNQVIFSNANGEVLFENVPPGTYSYTIEKSSFFVTKQELIVTENKSIQVILNAIPFVTVSFEITELGAPANNINVLFNKAWLITGPDGKAVFNGIPVNTKLCYEINKWGYYVESDTLSEITENLTIPISLIPIPDLKVHVTNKKGDMSKAKVTYQNTTIYTSTSGIANFADIIPGENQSLLIEHAGYYSQTEQVLVSNEDQSIDLYLFKKSDLNIHISNGDIAIEGAQVLLGNSEKYSNYEGNVAFKANTEAVGISLAISNEGYYPITSQISFLKDVDIDTSIIMEMIPDLEITISSKGLPVAGANVSINASVYQTNENGKVALTDVHKGAYLCKIEKTGYYPIEQDIIVENSDLAVTFEMAAIPDVNFTISHNGTPLVGANVEMNSIIIESSTLGKASFLDIPSGNYSYTITKDGYNPLTSDISVANDDVELNLDMSLVSAFYSDARFIKVYPNPTDGKVQLTIPANQSYLKICIYDEAGVLVYTLFDPEPDNYLDLSRLEKGLYIISVWGELKNYQFKLVLK